MTIDTTIQGIPLILKTEPSLFSPNGVDPGTLCLLANVRFDVDDKVLDLGCGYGTMGIIEKGFNRLLVGGAMWLVTKREQWCRNKLSAVFGGVRVAQCDSYFTFEAIKKTPTYSSTASKRPGRRSHKSS